ncbi:MAG: ABC transporter permease [Woeseiaceae bacterium]|nr:ABC transporter permease [Woeseiaceae bacterium]
MTSLTRLLAVMRKEFRQLRRDRITFAMIVGIPVGQILLFGYAINFDVRNIRAAVADQADTQLSRQFVDELEQTQVMRVVARRATPDALVDLLRRGEISVGIHVPADFERRIIDPRRPAAQLLVDGADPTIAGIVKPLARMPLDFRDPPASPTAGRTLAVRTYYNPEGRTAVNVVPGLIGIILTLTMMLFTAVAIVREREHGNLELLINTPVSTTQLMVGKIVPYILIGLVQLALIAGVGRLLFDVPVRGSLLDLYVAAFVFIAANLALGLFISTVARTQFQAMQVTFFVLLPTILLSGFVFPFEGMPVLAQWLGELLPNTHFIRMTRGIMLREATLVELWPELVALVVFTAIAMTLAISRFSRRLD